MKRQFYIVKRGGRRYRIPVAWLIGRVGAIEREGRAKGKEATMAAIDDWIDQERMEIEAKTSADIIVHYPSLDRFAMELADDVCRRINLGTSSLEADTPYKAQYVLEETVRILKARI